MNKPSPVISTIEVIHCGPTGIIALVDGHRQSFPDLDAVFRIAIGLLDEQAQPQIRPGPSLRQGSIGHPLPLPGFTP
jgi:hypothetical protein